MLSEADARCCVTLWLFAICVRGPILYLHELRANTAKWALGKRYGKFGPALMAAFWCTLAAVAIPGNPLLLALASGLTAIHQFNAMQHGGSMSYTLVFMVNIPLATAATAATIAGKRGVAEAVNAATPAIVDSYCLYVFFAALSKLNSDFFHPQRSAATAHVMASIENLVAGTPLRQPCRRLVDWTGPSAMCVFFKLTAVAGAVTEALVPLLMYFNAARAQVIVMFGMHGLFTLTRYDFSAVAAGLFPLWGYFAREGSVAAWLGWTGSPAARVLLPIALAVIMFRNGAREWGDAWDKLKVHELRLVCQLIYIAACPLMYIPTDIPPGALLLRLGSTAQADAWRTTREDLGDLGARAMLVASIASCTICFLNGSGPFFGWKTQGSISILYSNIVVENANKANHVLSPLLRIFGFPLPAVRDLVKVLETDADEVYRQLCEAPIAPDYVFEGLKKKSGWEKSGICHWGANTIQWVDYTCPGRGLIHQEDWPPVMPYYLAYFSFRCLISKIVAQSDRDFYVVYEYRGAKMRFERKGGKTLMPETSDMRLVSQPNMYVRKIVMFVPVPCDFRY